jgi:hypothetical protein
MISTAKIRSILQATNKSSSDEAVKQQATVASSATSFKYCCHRSKDSIIAADTWYVELSKYREAHNEGEKKGRIEVRSI